MVEFVAPGEQIPRVASIRFHRGSSRTPPWPQGVLLRAPPLTGIALVDNKVSAPTRSPLVWRRILVFPRNRWEGMAGGFAPQSPLPIPIPAGCSPFRPMKLDEVILRRVGRFRVLFFQMESLTSALLTQLVSLSRS